MKSFHMKLGTTHQKNQTDNVMEHDYAMADQKHEHDHQHMNTNTNTR